MGLKVKDKIKFRVLTRFGYKTAERKITSIFDDSYVGVKFEGSKDFIISASDIIRKL